MQPSQSYDMAPRPHTPVSGSYDSYAPRAPGTPGTFASDAGAKRHSDVPSTYFFNKEGGPAALAATDAGAVAPVKARGGPLGFVRRRPVLTGLLVLLLVAIGVGAGVGASMAMKSSSAPANASAANEGSKSSGAGTHSGSATATATQGSGGNSTSSSTNTTAAAPAFTPFAQWSFTDPNKKMFGVSLGNWLVLERWMNEDWMIQQGGDNAVDEWTLTQILGNKAKDVLSAHWDSWVSEAELDKLQAVGVNYIRIPVGYWAFIPAANGEPYLAMQGQKEQIDKVLGWMSTRGMYAMIDLHGMPGSQNGDQSCGHTTDTINWFSDYNQGLSDQTVDAVIAWINQNQYKSLISSVGVVNEPRPNGNSGRLATLTSFYERSYQKLKSNNLTMFFHHGFITGGSPLDYWRDFATGKDPNYLVYEDHPYPGYFPLNTDQDNMISRVCQLAQNAVGFPIPMAITEWSAVNGGGTFAFTKQYYNTQVSAWAWSAGSTFWSFKLMHSSTKVLAVADYLQDQYSMLTMIDQGVITAPASGQSAFDAIKALPNQQCGNIPTPKWSNPSKQGAGYQGRRRDVAAADGLVRRTRSKRAL